MVTWPPSASNAMYAPSGKGISADTPKPVPGPMTPMGWPSIAPPPPYPGQLIRVTDTGAIFGRQSRKLVYSSRSDFESFARFVEVAELTPPWAKHARSSTLRVTAKLRALFHAAKEDASQALPPVALARLVAPEGPMAWSDAATIALLRKLDPEWDEFTDSPPSPGLLAAVRALLGVVAALIRGGIEPDVMLEVVHDTDEKFHFRLADGEQYIDSCWRRTFQTMAMRADLQGWLHVEALSPSRTVMRLTFDVFLGVVASIRESASIDALLAAHVDPVRFAQYAKLYLTP